MISFQPQQTQFVPFSVPKTTHHLTISKLHNNETIIGSPKTASLRLLRKSLDASLVLSLTISFFSSRNFICSCTLSYFDFDEFIILSILSSWPCFKSSYATLQTKLQHITYRNMLPNTMGTIGSVLFVISLESLFFLNRVRPLRFHRFHNSTLKYNFFTAVGILYSVIQPFNKHNCIFCKG